VLHKFQMKNTWCDSCAANIIRLYIKAKKDNLNFREPIFPSVTNGANPNNLDRQNMGFATE
jgi:hypothetical protein